MNVTDTSWSLGVLIGLPVFLICIVIAILFAIGSLIFGEYDAVLGFLVSGGVALALIVAMAWGFYPYKAEYHQWQTVTGEVQAVEKRLLKDGDGMSERFVVEIDGQQLGCDDTRCADVKVGDTASLSCKREWQYTGTDGYGCTFVDRKAANR